MIETTSTAAAGASRRDVMKLAGLGVVALALSVRASHAQQGAGEMTQDWDKTLPKSNAVNHRKVTYQNRVGIELVADMYSPKTASASAPLPAIVVGHPYGGVKEQTPGFYAQSM